MSSKQLEILTFLQRWELGLNISYHLAVLLWRTTRGKFGFFSNFSAQKYSLRRSNNLFFFLFFFYIERSGPKKMLNWNMDLLIENLLSESTFDFGKSPNFKNA